MERIAHKLVSSLPGLVVRGAGECLLWPSPALYATDLARVLASPLGGSRRSWSRELKRAELRVSVVGGTGGEELPKRRRTLPVASVVDDAKDEDRRVVADGAALEGENLSLQLPGDLLGGEPRAPLQ